MSKTTNKFKKVVSLSIGIFLIALIITSSIATQSGTIADTARLTPSPTTPSGQSGTFGYTTIGPYTDETKLGEKDSCRYQAAETGTTTSISMYFRTSGASVRFGVYSDRNGRPDQLLGQSNWVETKRNSWASTLITVPIVAGRHYWLTIISTSTVSWAFNSRSSALAVIGKDTNTLSLSYGLFTSAGSRSFSIYATYTTTVKPSPTPAPTQLPVSTSTPTPIPTSSPTPKPTATLIPTPAPTPLPTTTQTPIPTLVPTPRPTITPIPSPSPTQIPTVTPIPTATPTPKPSSTPSPTLPPPAQSVSPSELGVWFAGSGAVIPKEATWVFANTPDYIPSNSNKIANSGFEFAWRGWSLFAPSPSQLAVEVRNGLSNKSVVMTSQEGGYRGGLYQYLANVPPNTTFNYKAMIKTANVENLESVVLYYEIRDSQGRSCGAGSLGTIQGSKNWALYETAFTTPNVTTSVTVYPSLVYNRGEVWLDDVYLGAQGWISNGNVSVVLNWLDLHTAWGKNGENTFKTASELGEIEALLKAVPTKNFWGITFISEEIYRTHVAFNDDVNTTWFGETLLGYPLYKINNQGATVDDWKDEMYLRMIRGFYNYFSPSLKVGTTWGLAPSDWDRFYGNPATNFIKQHYDFLFLYPFTENLNDWLTNSKPYLSAVDNLFPNQKKFWIITRIWDHNIDVWEQEAMALEIKNCLDRNTVIALYLLNNPSFEMTWDKILFAIELYNGNPPYYEYYVHGENLFSGYIGDTYGWVRVT